MVTVDQRTGEQLGNDNFLVVVGQLSSNMGYYQRVHRSFLMLAEVQRVGQMAVALAVAAPFPFAVVALAVEVQRSLVEVLEVLMLAGLGNLVLGVTWLDFDLGQADLAVVNLGS